MTMNQHPRVEPLFPAAPAPRSVPVVPSLPGAAVIFTGPSLVHILLRLLWFSQLDVVDSEGRDFLDQGRSS